MSTDHKKLIARLYERARTAEVGQNGTLLTIAAAALEHHLAENADLRARLEQAERELESVDRALDFAHSSRTRWDNGEEIQRSRTDRIDGMGQAGAYWRSTIVHLRSEIRQERDSALAELERAQAEVKRLREVELLAKDYRRAWKAFQTVPALHEETGSIAWAEVDKAYGAATAALEELLAVLGKEAAE